MTAIKNSNNLRTGSTRIILPCLAAVVALTAANALSQESQHQHRHNDQPAPAKLVQIVRDATRRFENVNVATSAGYQPAFGCVSGPDHGAMGVHYINGALVGDGLVDATKPEALIYEPTKDGMKLVGVEFIVDAATWMKTQSAPPMLEGQAFQFVNAPNRYGIPSCFELHVWAWRDNPNGAFSDWNNRVTCEHQ